MSGRNCPTCSKPQFWHEVFRVWFHTTVQDAADCGRKVVAP